MSSAYPLLASKPPTDRALPPNNIKAPAPRFDLSPCDPGFQYPSDVRSCSPNRSLSR